MSLSSWWIILLGTPHQSFSQRFIEIKIAVRRLVAPKFVSLLLKHVVKDLHAQEHFFILFLKILFTQDLEGFFISERLTSKRVSVFGNLVCNWTHERNRTVSC